MSANLVVDLGGTCQSMRSLPSSAVAVDGGVAITSGGTVSSLSGVLIGDVVDMLHSDTFCNVYITGTGFGSGPLVIGVQSSDSTASGTFTDPTSGLAQLPTSFQSGGFLILGSGPGANIGIFGSGQSGSFLLSGFMAFAAFQRPGRYARLFVGSGFYDGALQAGFVSQYKTTGSGGGFSYSPGSGQVNV